MSETAAPATRLMFRGKDVETMTRDELIVAVKYAAGAIERERASAKREREFWSEMRRARP